MPTNISAGLSNKGKKYLYFKTHDLDDNNKLDGLEMYYSVTRRSSLGLHENAQINLSLAPSAHGQALNENEELVGCGFDHIIGMITCITYIG